MCVQVGFKRGIIELESAIAISLYRAAALYADPEHEGISFSLPSIPPPRTLAGEARSPFCPGGRDRRAERGDELERGRTWSVFRVFREINPLVLSMYTRRRRSPAMLVSVYTHGISIIWIVKVFGRQLQPPNLCSPPSARLPRTITRGCPLRRTLHTGNIDAMRTRLANLNLNATPRIKLFYSEAVLSQAARQESRVNYAARTRDSSRSLLE